VSLLYLKMYWVQMLPDYSYTKFAYTGFIVKSVQESPNSLMHMLPFLMLRFTIIHHSFSLSLFIPESLVNILIRWMAI